MPTPDLRVRDKVDLPDRFLARYWIRPTHESVDAFDPYAETFWVSAIGPTTFVLARRLLLEPREWDKADLATAIGIGYRGNEKCPLERAISRLVRFELAAPDTDRKELYVLPKWPRLRSGHIAKLPKYMRDIEPETFAREQE